MLSRTNVINLALGLIGVNQIADPAENSNPARRVAAVYDQVVRSELEKYPWGFARRQASLPALADAPTFRFARAFNLPSNFLRLVDLGERGYYPIIRQPDTAPLASYEISGRTLLTDLAAPLHITYVADLSDDPTLWSPTFVDVVKSAIAKEVAYPLAVSDTMTERATKTYQMAVTAARRTAAIQAPPQQIPDGSWIVARYV